MLEVEDYIYTHLGNQREIFLFLHELLTIEFGMDSKIRYRVPFYFGKSWIIYTKAIKDDGVELSFIRGRELSNSHGILDDKGRKMVSGISIYDIKSIPLSALKEDILEAMMLDETVPYNIRSSKK